MAQRMLEYCPMSRIALALVMVAASATVASAGGFVGLGIGTGAATSGDFDIEENGRSGRLMLGYRFGRISIEGLGSRYAMLTPDNNHEYTGTTLGLAGKYNLPLQDNFEVFGRLGIQRTGITADHYDEELSGGGFLVGGGAEFKLPIAAAAVSLFVDYTIIYSSMESWNASDLSVTSRIWALGATLSF